MPKSNKCHNCHIHPIHIKDYREQGQCIGSVFSCLYCFNLNDKEHNKVNTKKLNPKTILETKAITWIDNKIKKLKANQII